MTDKALHYLMCFSLALIHPALAVLFALGKEVDDLFRYGSKMIHDGDGKEFAKMVGADLVADALGVVGAMMTKIDWTALWGMASITAR